MKIIQNKSILSIELEKMESGKNLQERIMKAREMFQQRTAFIFDEFAMMVATRPASYILSKNGIEPIPIEMPKHMKEMIDYIKEDVCHHFKITKEEVG